MKKIVGCVIINFFSDGTVETSPRAISDEKKKKIKKQVNEFKKYLKGV